LTTTAPTQDDSQPGAVRADRVEGPLKGYHHQTFAVRLDPASPLARDFPWLKLREPREGVLWYDMRWFPSEDGLLRLLHERHSALLPRIPQVSEQPYQGKDVTFLEFIEGVTLDRVRGGRTGRVDERYLRQIEQLFHSLAAVDAESLVGFGSSPERACRDSDLSTYPRVGGSTEFLRRLTHFTVVHAYHERRKDMEELLDRLRMPTGALDAFLRDVPRLTDRPRMLLHGDLHRKNFVVDRVGDLWTIDWELALVGDPLYDLATHLHLMDYQSDQERDVVARWQRAVGGAASAGAQADLPHYRAYKQVQSLCTDVLRATTRLKESEEQPGTPEGAARLRSTATIVRRALAAAGAPLGLGTIPTRGEVEKVFSEWWRRDRRSV
jgi:Phosphotransferase enzyme family